MIVAVDILGARSVKSEYILYGYDDSGFKVVTSLQYSDFTSSTVSLFGKGNLLPVSTPTYNDFKATMITFGFVVFTHAALTEVCLNAKNVAFLIPIDGSNTRIHFDEKLFVDVVASESAVITALNTGIYSTPSYLEVSTDIVGDALGQLNLPYDYVPGSWRVFVRGALIMRSLVSETGSNQLTIDVGTYPIEDGDFINVEYKKIP